MTKNEFKKRFIKAIEESLKETKKIVTNDLPNNFVINLYSRTGKNNYLRLFVDDAIEKLYVSGSIPKWIDVNVVKVDNDFTIIECQYSDIFLDNDNLLQFHNDPLSPFNLGGPYLPPDWKGLEKNGKFKLLDYDEKEGRPIISHN